VSGYSGRPTVAPTLRAPRAQVLLNGAVMDGLVSATIHLKNNFEAAEFTIDANVEPTYAMNIAWWSTQAKVVATIQIGYQTGASVAWQTVLTGVVDEYDIDLDGRTISLPSLSTPRRPRVTLTRHQAKSPRCWRRRQGSRQLLR
jgi:hypothetical protein